MLGGTAARGSRAGMRANWAAGIIVGIERSGAMGIGEPPHPGGFFRRQCLEPLGLSVSKSA